jgi:uncharacterized protein YpbB/nucleoside-triphosphatase THEP1
MDNEVREISPAELAAKCINQTNRCVFLTGKAGTGKTTFLRNIIDHTHKNAIIVAPTGIAAINAGGVTIHSQFGIPFGLFIPDSSFRIDNFQVKINTPHTLVKHLNMREQKRRLLQELELLVIDEVSMLRADLLDTIDFVLRSIRRQQHKPFGGVQVLFIGDLMQLPPVVKEEEWRIMNNYYNSIYFFDAQVLRNNKPLYIELDKIYRQSDSVFIDLLNNLRNNTVTQSDIDLLNRHYLPDAELKPSLNTITLTTHNFKADSINKTALQKLNGKSFFFYAQVEGDFSEHAYPVDAMLELKVGAQIMFIKNDMSGRQQYFNGKIGVVSTLTENSIEIDFKDGSKPFLLETYQWRNIKYELNPVTNDVDEKDIGTFVQYPIKLAWAITVHKSQGLTFEKAILDINRAFAPGQVYVALSRLKSLNGLILTSPLQFTALSQDKTLKEYSEGIPKSEELKQLIDQETVLFLKGYILKTYDFVWLFKSFKTHLSSYTMSENRSVKQKNLPSAEEWVTKLDPLRFHAEKFCNQLQLIFDERKEGFLNLIAERHAAAKNYFYPVLKEMSKNILQQSEGIKDEKQVKAYLEELLELEGLIYKQLTLLDKFSLVIDHVLNGKELNKMSANRQVSQLERMEIVQQTQALTEKLAFEEKRGERSIKKGNKSGSKVKSPKLKSEKKSKKDTKAITYELFQQGKPIEEIAVERSLTMGTIENHLSHFVSLGLIPVTRFVSKDIYDKILKYAIAHETGSGSVIKQALGDNVSYADIKFTLATRKYLKKD